MERQLYRPIKNRVIAGVCGGLAEYFNIDPAIIRILCVILAFTGTGFLAYIIAWIIMPDERNIEKTTYESSNAWQDSAGGSFDSFDDGKNSWDRPAKAKYDSEKNKFAIGALLVGLGALLLIKQIFPHFGLQFFVPLLLVGIGAAIIYRGRRA